MQEQEVGQAGVVATDPLIELHDLAVVRQGTLSFTRALSRTVRAFRAGGDRSFARHWSR